MVWNRYGGWIQGLHFGMPRRSAEPFRRGMIVVAILANAALIGALYLGWHLSAFKALQLVSAGVLFAVLEVLIFFPYRLWKSNKSEIDRLNARLAPKLKCTFGMDIPGCVSPDVVTNNPAKPHKPGIQLTWYRIKVETVGGINLNGCNGRLLSVRRGNKELLVGDAPVLAFTPADDRDAFDKTIHSFPSFLTSCQPTQPTESST
jgi:hypothetical protein